MKKFIYLIFVVLNFLNFTYSSPSGAPDSSCNTMRPNHGAGITEQTSAPPYKIVTSSLTVNGGEEIQVSIESLGSEKFRGFLIMAFSDDGKVVGEFSESLNETQQINIKNCPDFPRNGAVTHANNIDKNLIKFLWKAPSDYNRTIYFQATIVKEKVIYWKNIKSLEVSVKSTFDQNEIYENCGETKYCLGYPKNCVKSKSCSTFGAIYVQNEKFFFEMYSANRVAYVALALSDDDKMGSDSVIECVNERDTINQYTSITRAIPSNYGSRRTDIDQNIIKLVNSRNIDGSIYCLVERAANTTIDDINFDMRTSSYYLLLASGSTAQFEVSIGFHDIIKMSSSYSKKFEEGQGDIFEPVIKEFSKTLVMIHGSFMIVGWILCTSLGIFSARFGKRLFFGRKLFNKDIWFVIHQFSMTITWILVISSVVIIWIDVGEWKTSTHSVLGIISAVLCFIQPITAFFRPAPNDEARPIFNFMHGSVGKLAQLLAVIAIFIATTLPQVGLEEWSKYILISYIVVYLVFFAMLNNLGIISGIKKKNDDEMTSMRITRFRMIIFFIFVLAVIGFTISLIIAVTDI